MNCRALSLRCRFLFHAIETLILTYYDSFVLVSSQGHFPRLENVGAFKNVSIVPTQATCGLPDRSTFCHSSVAVQSIISCTQRFCVQECPYSSSPPSYKPLLSEGFGTCITEDKRDLHPGSSSNASSFIFHNHKDCFSTPRPLRLGASFTLTVWLKPEREGVMCVIEKAIDGQTVFKLTISEKETMFYYRTVNGLQPPIKVTTLGRILVKKWIHLSVQVHHSRINFFLNGWEDDNTPFDSRTLMGTMEDTDADGTLQIGQSFTGKSCSTLVEYAQSDICSFCHVCNYYILCYNRDILEVFSGKFPHLHTQSECRCPGSHPRVHPLIQRYCIPNGADDTTNDRVLRLDAEAHPLYYINDNDIGTTWISSVFANTASLDRGVSITIDLQNGQYQVFYIILQFFSPHPEAIKIERKKRDDLEWEDWQYFARNCSIFEMENNGSLEKPDSVNCLQMHSFTPYSRGNLTFSILTPEPNHRPGYNDFYNTPSLQEFVKATQVRIHLRGQYHTNEPWVNFRHRYYGVNEVTVSGRCNCHGHADDCDTAIKPYRCLCVKESYTEGNNCDRCLPLYNDKPFRPGDQVHAYNCKPCQCYGHAESCHYDLAMDPFPLEHHRGGGGVCDNCQHNTAGMNCELCKDFHYRQAGADLSAIDVCKPCDCNATGTKNKSLLCDNIGGQCNCKRHVSGRQCNQCQEGFYSLQQSNPDGCSPCNCNTSGTVNGDITCHQNSGQCKCKANVIGLRCDSCNFGFKALRYSNEDGCEPCWCNSHGSVSQFCNPLSGQCNCKERVKGLLCDTCVDNFYGLDVTGCKACECDAAGSISGTVCDVRTGQCVCKPNIGGRRCDECLDGYHRVQKGPSFLCLPCNCEKAGTVNGSLLCDKSTGQCPCKAGVTGLRCSQCMQQTYNLSLSNAHGCQPCDCDALGTLAGTVCDHVSGQCVCLPQRQGRRCGECKPGFYFSPSSITGCLPCLCHIAGSVNQICDKLTGQCSCQDASVTGQTCEHCKELYFGFDSVTGRCQHCNCHPAGAISGTCHLVTGQCVCKQFVTGLKCDNCVPDASNLDVHNLFGCSKTPFQQPPPTGEVLNSSVINLSWSSPDSPNSNKLIYQLYRDEEEIYTTEDYHPYSVQMFTDTMLAPYTFYSYYIQASNVHGFTRSDSVTYRTKSGTPIGSLDLNPVFPVSHHSVLLYWTSVSNDSGPIEKYILTCVDSVDLQPCGQYEGLKTSAIIWNLIPFTKYVFSVQACTSGGCLKSQPVTVVTAQAPPEGLHPPTVKTISSTELAVEWSPPEKPNGIIIRYELYMRKKFKSAGNFLPHEIRVFQSSGWLSPQPVVESQNENALAPPQTSTTVADLEPFTEYEFYVLAVNMAGSISSDWVSGRTGEAAPAFMPSPSVFPLSPYSLNVSWEKPEDNASRGEVMGYSISLMTEQRSLPPFSQVLHIAEAHELSYVATGLKPYRTYNFTVTLCNQIGCVTSEPGMGQTLAAGKETICSKCICVSKSEVTYMLWVCFFENVYSSPEI
uniref:Usherin n=1 Tax=Cyanistes caeruleus TaxID=156563 RepID=A0A8C0V279_CYACU